jgi:hypothetical protein
MSNFLLYFFIALVPIAGVLLFIVLLTVERIRRKEEEAMEIERIKKVNEMFETATAGAREKPGAGRPAAAEIDMELEDIRSKLMEAEEAAYAGERTVERKKTVMEKTDPATLGKMLATMIKK